MTELQTIEPQAGSPTTTPTEDDLLSQIMSVLQSNIGLIVTGVSFAIIAYVILKTIQEKRRTEWEQMMEEDY